MDTAIRTRGLRKEYPTSSGTFVALDGVDLDIERGEVFALLGPNGAGKSTTIEILEGFRTRTAGEVSVLGEDPQHGGPAWRARLGIVAQSTGETGTATVQEILRHFATLYPVRRDPDEVIAAVGLTQQAGTRIGKLSGGQRRRVDVALGIIGAPELLFLDEPTTGFDPAARRQFWELIRSLREGGTTIVLTTHYLDEAAELSDRGGVIAAGKLLEVGPINALGSTEARVPIVRWRDSSGAVRSERTSEPGRLVKVLAADAEPRDLEVVRPSLEDVYLQMIEPHTRPAQDGAAA